MGPLVSDQFTYSVPSRILVRPTQRCDVQPQASARAKRGRTIGSCNVLLGGADTREVRQLFRRHFFAARWSRVPIHLVAPVAKRISSSKTSNSAGALRLPW